MNDAVQVMNLKKSYGNNLVLNGLTFNVARGEIFALLGVNGAGKTTVLECIEGLRKYDSGEIISYGKKGIQLQSSSLPEHIKPLEAIRLFAKWNKVSIDAEMLNSLGIGEFSKKRYYQLSTGQKRRLHLALALIGNPDIIFLDEPTAGLDVEGKISLHRLIRELKACGKTIILAGHDMSEIESLCDRIAILSDGNIGFIGTISELNTKIGDRYNVSVQTCKGSEEFEADDFEEVLFELTDYYKQGVVISAVQINRGSLEQHFIKVAKGE